jgi:GDP-4-dehydro-6-deoxy-D-mannose reductase
VYGGVLSDELPVSELTPVRPNHNYSLSKAMAELVCQRFGNTSSAAYVVARAFNHIGPGQRSDFAVPNFARQLAEIKLGKREAVIEVGNLQAERDFTDVRDIVRGYRLAATQGHGVYNFCSGAAVSVQRMLDELIEISGLEVEVRQDPSRLRPIEIPRLYGSFERARRSLGWEPRLPRLQSLTEIYQEWLTRVGEC